MHIGEVTSNRQPAIDPYGAAGAGAWRVNGPVGKSCWGKCQTQLLQMKSEGRIVKRVQRAKACGVKAKQTLMICGNAMGILCDFSRIGGKLNLMMRCQGSSPSCDAKQDKSQPVGWDSSCVGLFLNVKDAILHSLWPRS